MAQHTWGRGSGSISDESWRPWAHLQAGMLTGMFPNDQVIMGLTVKGGYPLACSAMSLIYLVGMGLIWLAPETKGKPLPE